MIVLTGASASGKTEVAKMLAKKYGIVKVITTTTRDIRINEENGKDYFFVSKERFEEMIKQNLFVETTLYNSNYYGSTKDQIQNNKAIVIDPVGLKSYIALNDPRIITFYLEAREETRRKRMEQRGDDPEKIIKRIENDRIAFSRENIAKTDFYINSETQNIEEVTDNIYKLYKEALKNRE